MVLPLLRAQENLLPSFVFGKLPSRPDFVRINATHPAAREFDELLQKALGCLREQEGWESRYDQAGPVDVCFSSRDQKWLFLGVLQPSMDQSGRRFPLVAGLGLPQQSLMTGQEIFPIALEVYFKTLREFLSSIAEGAADVQEARSFLEVHSTELTSGSEGFPLARQIMKPFLEARHPRVLGEILTSMGASLPQSLLNITFYRDFLRRFYNPSAIQALEIPLKPGPGEANLFACAWLMILAAISGDTKGWSSGFLLVNHPVHPRLLTSFGRMSESALVAAMGGAIQEDDRLDLTHEKKAWLSNKLYAETSYALERLLHDSELRISALCQFLKDLGKKISEAEG